MLSKAFMCSQHFKRHSTCCMLSAVRLQGWILQCFRKKVRQEESVRGGNRPSFVEFFLRVYAWLYKRTFFFLTSKRQYYFTQTCFQEQPSYFYMNQCLVEAVTVKGKPSLQVRHGNSLTSAAKPINTRAMGQWKRNWNTSGQHRWGQVCKGEGTACFFQSKDLTKKEIRRHARLGRRGKQGKTSGIETLVRKAKM